MVDKQTEAVLVVLSMEESALGRKIESAERRAERRCAIYDSSNIYWKNVDELLEMQQHVIKKISDLNDKLSSSISSQTVDIDALGSNNATLDKPDGQPSDMIILKHTTLKILLM